MSLILPTHYRVKRVKLYPFRCLSNDCRTTGNSARIVYLPDARETCPHCHRPGNLSPLEIIHLIQPSKFQGQVPGSEMAGTLDIKYAFLCEASHLGYQQSPRSPNQPRSYTLLPEAATCLACLLEYGASLTNALVQLPRS